VFAFFRKSFRIGRAFGIDVYVHATFLLLLAFLALMNWNLGPVGVIFALVLTLLVFGLVVLHEFGHALTAKGFGLRVQRITIWPLGGIAWTEPARTPFSEFVISLAGPMVNFVFVGLTAAALLLWGGARDMGELFRGPGAGTEGGLLEWFARYFLLINVVLGVFNLLPAFPMDGGRVLRSALSHFYGSLRGTHLAVKVARVVALIMIVGGLALLFSGRGGIMLPLIGGFVWLMSGVELWRVRAQGGAYVGGGARGPTYDASGGGGNYGSAYDPGHGYADAQPAESSYAREVKPGVFARLKARWRERTARRAEKRFLADAAERRKIQERVEVLLDKVSREGMTSLTDAERRELVDASRFFQR